MKPSHCHAFGDQVHILSEWFSQWNDCEQTIALYSLLKKITAPQARFLSLVLEHSFRDSSIEVQILEKQANDQEFLCSLCSQTKDVAVQQLLCHLPLLHPGNDKARSEYLNLLHKILSHSMEHGIHKEECRQLLSLARVHPAFPLDERRNVTMWLSHLDGKLYDELQQQQQQMISQETHSSCDNMIRQNYMRSKMNGMSGWRHQQLVHRDSGLGGSFETQPMHPPAKRTDSGLGGSFDSPLNPVGVTSYPHLNITVTSAPGPPSSNTHPPLSQSRSNSLTPPPVLDLPGGTSQPSETVLVEETWDEDLISSRPNRSRSFPVDPSRLHYPLSPQSSFESECGDDYCIKSKPYSGNNNEEWKLGMKDVPAWLKSLRLHKYSSLFQQLTYEEMMALSEERLDEKGVTKGARNKILLSVQKLSERSQKLVSLEKEVLKGGNLKEVLAELKNILITPIKPYSSPISLQPSTNQTNTPPEYDDLPSWITRVMGKACTQILVSKPDEENWQTYMQLLDRVINHDSFTAIQKKRFQSWKQQCRRSAPQFPRRPSQDKGRGWSHPDAPGSSNALAGSGVRPRHRAPIRISKAVPNGSPMQNLHPPAGQCRSNNTETCFLTSKPRLQRGHAVVSRTKSAPIPPTQPQTSLLPHQVSADMERINNSLESLCLSMTECALEDSESNDKM